MCVEGRWLMEETVPEARAKRASEGVEDEGGERRGGVRSRRRHGQESKRRAAEGEGETER